MKGLTLLKSTLRSLLTRSSIKNQSNKSGTQSSLDRSPEDYKTMIAQMTPTGPVIQILVGANYQLRDKRRRANSTIPAFIPIRAVIDTGADGTSISDEVLAQLELPVAGSTSIYDNVTGEQDNVQCYDTCLMLRVGNHIKIFHMIYATPYRPSERDEEHSIKAIIGWDVLANVDFSYDCNGKRFILSFEGMPITTQ